jgi:hypothetical protein
MCSTSILSANTISLDQLQLFQRGCVTWVWISWRYVVALEGKLMSGRLERVKKTKPFHTVFDKKPSVPEMTLCTWTTTNCQLMEHWEQRIYWDILSGKTTYIDTAWYLTHWLWGESETKRVTSFPQEFLSIHFWWLSMRPTCCLSIWDSLNILRLVKPKKSGRRQKAEDTYASLKWSAKYWIWLDKILEFAILKGQCPKI